MALSELEKQLGHKLFDRNNNRLLINEQGKRLLPLADELLARSQDIEQLFSQEGPVTGKLKIGSSDTVGNQVTPFLLRDFQTRLRPLRSKPVHCQYRPDLPHAGREFELDIGLVEGKVQQIILP